MQDATARRFLKCYPSSDVRDPACMVRTAARRRGREILKLAACLELACRSAVVPLNIATDAVAAAAASRPLGARGEAEATAAAATVDEEEEGGFSCALLELQAAARGVEDLDQLLSAPYCGDDVCAGDPCTDAAARAAGSPNGAREAAAPPTAPAATITSAAGAHSLCAAIIECALREAGRTTGAALVYTTPSLMSQAMERMWGIHPLGDFFLARSQTAPRGPPDAAAAAPDAAVNKAQSVWKEKLGWWVLEDPFFRYRLYDSCADYFNDRLGDSAAAAGTAANTPAQTPPPRPPRGVERCLEDLREFHDEMLRELARERAHHATPPSPPSLLPGAVTPPPPTVPPLLPTHWRHCVLGVLCRVYTVSLVLAHKRSPRRAEGDCRELLSRQLLSLDASAATSLTEAVVSDARAGWVPLDVVERGVQAFCAGEPALAAVLRWLRDLCDPAPAAEGADSWHLFLVNAVLRLDALGRLQVRRRAPAGSDHPVFGSAWALRAAWNCEEASVAAAVSASHKRVSLCVQRARLPPLPPRRAPAAAAAAAWEPQALFYRYTRRGDDSAGGGTPAETDALPASQALLLPHTRLQWLRRLGDAASVGGDGPGGRHATAVGRCLLRLRDAGSAGGGDSISSGAAARADALALRALEAIPLPVWCDGVCGANHLSSVRFTPLPDALSTAGTIARPPAYAGVTAELLLWPGQSGAGDADAPLMARSADIDAAAAVAASPDDLGNFCTVCFDAHSRRFVPAPPSSPSGADSASSTAALSAAAASPPLQGAPFPAADVLARLTAVQREAAAAVRSAAATASAAAAAAGAAAAEVAPPLPPLQYTLEVPPHQGTVGGKRVLAALRSCLDGGVFEPLFLAGEEAAPEADDASGTGGAAAPPRGLRLTLAAAYPPAVLVDLLLLPPVARALRDTNVGAHGDGDATRAALAAVRRQLLLVLHSRPYAEVAEFVGDGVVDFIVAMRRLTAVAPPPAVPPQPAPRPFSFASARYTTAAAASSASAIAGARQTSVASRGPPPPLLWDGSTFLGSASNRVLHARLPPVLRAYVRGVWGVSSDKSHADLTEALVGAVAIALWVLPTAARAASPATSASQDSRHARLPFCVVWRCAATLLECLASDDAVL